MGSARADPIGCPRATIRVLQNTPRRGLSRRPLKNQGHTAMVMYNTLMGVCAATGLLLIAALGWLVWRGRRLPSLSSWAWTFAPLGLILVVMGAHMSLTWPLKPAPASLSPHCCAADNIIFGEPSLFFGALLLALAALLLSIERSAPWRAWEAAPDGASASSSAADVGKARELLARRLLPLAAVGAVAGLTLFPIGLAGLVYGMFIAPPNEPFSSTFRANFIETYYIVAAYWLVGLGAVLLPFAMRWRGALIWLSGAALTIGALLFLWVSLVSYFGHIALS